MAKTLWLMRFEDLNKAEDIKNYNTAVCGTVYFGRELPRYNTAVCGTVYFGRELPRYNTAILDTL